MLYVKKMKAKTERDDELVRWWSCHFRLLASCFLLFLSAFGFLWCWCLLKMEVGKDILLSCYCCCLLLQEEGSGYCAVLAYCCSKWLRNCNW
ncbi:hypothetical protein POPTR_001G427901v4 [Populus trichocarpa]|uniref:Uncharacterized protein n=1 Tax=Populus trichocarpa TaxID=3694 RepID=A0ACC0TPD1_POPTR|nr:hypothetical protein POPTR_001G427901v4 [Populus trichocarpa]